MDKKILVIIFVLTSVLAALFLFSNRNPSPSDDLKVETVESSQTNSDSSQSDVQESNANEMKLLVSQFVFNGRKAGTQSNLQAAYFIKEQLEAYGLPTMLDAYEMNGEKSQNVYAWIEGSDPSKVVVVGAHFDYLEGLPGADDNASGVAVVLQMARAFSKVQLANTVVFQFYTGKESGRNGSKLYCAYPKFPKDAPDLRSHVLMMNVDAVGHLNNRDLRECLFSNEMNGDGDQVSFAKSGVSSVLVTTGADPRHKTAQDTADTLDYSGMEFLTRYLMDVVLFNMDGN